MPMGVYTRKPRPPRPVRPLGNPEFDFWPRVAKNDGCWLWTGGKTTAGYGLISLYRKPSGLYHRIYAHRYSWGLHFGNHPCMRGPMLPDILVCHHCDTPSCVRPDHLFLGTDADNAWDKSRKGRAPSGDTHGLRLHPDRVPRGERSGAAKLTEVDIRIIRQRYAAGGVTQQALGDEYGVANSHICHIIARKNWAHVL